MYLTVMESKKEGNVFLCYVRMSIPTFPFTASRAGQILTNEVSL